MKSAADQKVIRAIDVGYGNTKFVSYHKQGAQMMQCAIFPSITPHASTGGDLNAGVFQRRNTVLIPINGVVYEVGKDARLAQDASYGRALTSAYSLTDSYLALVRGAMYYMGEEHIDMLVVGLPVNTYQSHSGKLLDRLCGAHLVPKSIGGVPSAELVEVLVDEVRVLPQPVGAFFDHAISNNLYARMRSQMNLIIDPGFYTLEWVVSHAVKTINARSGAHSGGMSSILGVMAEAIGKDLGIQISDISGIDEALRLGVKPRFFNKELDLTEYIALAKEKARQFVGVMATKVGSQGVDINNIILAGGGAAFFEDVIQESFPHHDLIITPDPIYANVRGFQHAGYQFAKQDALPGKRDPSLAA